MRGIYRLIINVGLTENEKTKPHEFGNLGAKYRENAD